jgi:unsaturated rhamnogalacturonyl hydrolase
VPVAARGVRLSGKGTSTMTDRPRSRLGRVLIGAALGVALVASAAVAPSAIAAVRDGSTAPAAAAPVDWSVAVVDSEMARKSPTTLGGWGYTQGLFLYGTYLVYQRTHNPKYLAYIRSWADRFVGADGSIGNSFNNLDSMNSGNVLLVLYKETGQAKYKTAATKIRNRLKTYPRTSEGGFWHANNASRAHQLWGDGVFMVDPFLIRYGQIIGESGYANDESSKQLLITYKHLLNPSNGLLKHAWDESKKASWANKTTGQAPETWCRAEGWFMMATTEILEILPAGHPNRAALVADIASLVKAVSKFQNPTSGLWWQVVDRPGASGNFTETSCSSMYTYVISRAVERGYVDASYTSVASKGYQGVLTRVSKGSDGRTNVSGICIGTNVGNAAYYYSRPRATNDLHGLGSFLIMSEQLQRVGR